MNETIRLGTIAGIRIGVNWSVLVIAGLLLVGLSFGRFPLLLPGYGNLAYVVAGLIAATAFFASLLAHELAHALVARRNGVEVEGITLWMFGGVAKLLGEASNPGADLRIAGVGPLVSVTLGAVFSGLAMLATAMDVDDLAIDVLRWLALINVVLAVFNLVPAAPLDGGRILRALLWWRHGDRLRAAVVAARAGRRFGFMLVMFGLVLVVMLPGIGGLWFALIGWFISSAASNEEQHVRVQHSLRDIRVEDVMTPSPWTVPTGISVAQLLDDHVLRRRCSAFPMVDSGGRLRGLVTLHRIREVPADRRSAVPIDQIACPLDEVVQARRHDRLVDVLPAMARGSDGRVVVTDADRIVGIVSPTDVARALELMELAGAPIHEGRELARRRRRDAASS